MFKKSITSSIAICALSLVLPYAASADGGHGHHNPYQHGYKRVHGYGNYGYHGNYWNHHSNRAPVGLENGTNVTLHNGSHVTTKWQSSSECGCGTEPMMSEPYYVFFAHDSSKVSNEGHATIKKAYSDAMMHRAYKFKLSGHASKPGTDQYNMKLSGRRVSNVASKLEHMGVEGSKIMTAAFGETVPFHKHSGMSDHAKDRRVEIRYVYEK